QALILKWWQPYFEDDAGAAPDAKTALQEFAQGQKRGLPVYRIVETKGLDHAPWFVAEVEVKGLERARGEGPSKPKAQQAAAEAMLVREGVWKGSAGDNG